MKKLFVLVMFLFTSPVFATIEPIPWGVVEPNPLLIGAPEDVCQMFWDANVRMQPERDANTSLINKELVVIQLQRQARFVEPFVPSPLWHTYYSNMDYGGEWLVMGDSALFKNSVSVTNMKQALLDMQHCLIIGDYDMFRRHYAAYDAAWNNAIDSYALGSLAFLYARDCYSQAISCSTP